MQMSYDYRDEIKGDIEQEITDMLGGPVVRQEIHNGKTINIYSDPYDGYDKGGDIILYFNSLEDYDQVYENCPYKNRLIDWNRKERMLRFNCE